MSTEIVTGVFTLAGSIIGAAIALFGARFLRRRGKVHSFIIAWYRETHHSNGVAREGRGFTIRLHNEKT